MVELAVSMETFTAGAKIKPSMGAAAERTVDHRATTTEDQRPLGGNQYRSEWTGVRTRLKEKTTGLC